MKKKRKQSLLRLAAFITIGVGFASFVHQNNLFAASAGQKNQSDHYKRKSWFGSINKQLVSIMHGIIKQLKTIKNQMELQMKKMKKQMTKQPMKSQMKKMRKQMDSMKKMQKQIMKQQMKLWKGVHGKGFYEYE